jgi:hypothetical protein
VYLLLCLHFHYSRRQFAVLALQLIRSFLHPHVLDVLWTKRSIRSVDQPDDITGVHSQSSNKPGLRESRLLAVGELNRPRCDGKDSACIVPTQREETLPPGKRSANVDIIVC